MTPRSPDHVHVDPQLIFPSQVLFCISFWLVTPLFGMKTSRNCMPRSEQEPMTSPRQSGTRSHQRSGYKIQPYTHQSDRRHFFLKPFCSVLLIMSMQFFLCWFQANSPVQYYSHHIIAHYHYLPKMVKIWPSLTLYYIPLPLIT